MNRVVNASLLASLAFGLFVVSAPVFAEDAATGTVAASAASAEPDAPSVTWGADVDFMSDYVFRGVEANPDFSIQPNVWVSSHGFTGAVWGQWATEPNILLLDTPPFFVENDDLEEVDFTLSYAKPLGSTTLGLGYIHYHYPKLDDTNEIFATLGFSHTLAPSIGVYRDLNLDNTYFEAGIGPSWKASEDKVTFSPKFVFGWNKTDGAESTSYVRPGAVLGYALSDNFSVNGQVHYVLPLDGDNDGNFDQKFYGGVGIHFTN